MDLEPIIEQHEAAPLIRPVVEVKSPVVDDDVAKTQPRRVQLPVAHHGQASVHARNRQSHATAAPVDDSTTNHDRQDRS